VILIQVSLTYLIPQQIIRNLQQDQNLLIKRKSKGLLHLNLWKI